MQSTDDGGGAVSVREAVPADASAIERVHVSAIRGLAAASYDDEQVEAWATREGSGPPIGDPETHVVVAESGSDVVGFGQLDRVDGEVQAVYVAPDRAREGVGTAVLDRLERLARDAGLDGVFLLASLNAVPFYERAGYEASETCIHEVTGGVELECVRMHKPL